MGSAASSAHITDEVVLDDEISAPPLLEHAVPHNLEHNTYHTLNTLLDYQLSEALSDTTCINTSDAATGRTLLHEAVRLGDAEGVPLLIKHGADINALDDSGRLPLYYALQHTEPLRSDLMQHFPVVVNNSPKEVIHNANLRALLLAGRIDCNFAFKGDTVFHEAAKIGDTQVVSYLDANGADHKEDREGRLPICCLLSSEVLSHCEVSETLCGFSNRFLRTKAFFVAFSTKKLWKKREVEFGIDLNQIQEGMTMLHCAAELGDVETVSYLISHGAKSVRSGCGKLPLWFALKQQHGVDRISQMRTEFQPHFDTNSAPISSSLQAFLSTHDTHRTSTPAHSSPRFSLSNTPCNAAFIQPEHSTYPSLLSWFKDLPNLTPSLGYTEDDVSMLLSGFLIVCRRLERRIGAQRLDDWMLVEEPFEVLCAAYLYGSGGRVLGEGSKEILSNHGLQKTEGGVSLALSAMLDSAMRSASTILSIRHTPSANVFEVEPRLPQLNVFTCFQPLIVQLHRLLKSRHVATTTILWKHSTSFAYKPGSVLSWNCFTTARKVEEEVQEREGAFFLIVAESAVEVGFALNGLDDSDEPRNGEDAADGTDGTETLLYSNETRFAVQWRFSPTLLRLMGLRFDVIILREVCGVSPGRLSGMREVMDHTAPYFEAYLKRYVEGRVTADPYTSESQSELILKKVTDWLDSTPHTPLCLLGDAGSGKTSASVAIIAHLLRKPKRNSKPYFPIFISLPALRSKVLRRGAIDLYIRDAFALSKQDQIDLGETYHVVVLLDSLDEAGVTQEEMELEMAGGGVLARQPWVQRYCSVVLTARNEFFKSIGQSPATVLGETTKLLYLRNFTKEDVQHYLTRAHRGNAVQTASSLSAKGLTNPFLVHMSCTSGCMSRDVVDIYEAYLVMHIQNELKKIDRDIVEELMQVGELIACLMLDSNSWTNVIYETRRTLKRFGIESSRCNLCFACLPFRIEDKTEDSEFSFGHKSLAEYLIARRLLREPEDTLGLFQRSFSKDAQKVLGLFAALLQKRFCEDKVRTFVAIIKRSQRCRGGASVSSSSSWQRVVYDASNAAALLARTGLTLVDDCFDDILVQNADLRGLRLSSCSLRCATLCSTWLEHTEFSQCNLTNTKWNNSCFGSSVPPLRGHIRGVICCIVSKFRAFSGGEDGMIGIWCLKSGRKMGELVAGNAVNAVALVKQSEKYLASGGNDGAIKIWDLERQRFFKDLDASFGSPVSSLSASGAFFVAAGGTRVSVWRMDTILTNVTPAHTFHTTLAVQSIFVQGLRNSSSEAFIFVACKKTSGAHLWQKAVKKYHIEAQATEILPSFAEPNSLAILGSAKHIVATSDTTIALSCVKNHVVVWDLTRIAEGTNEVLEGVWQAGYPEKFSLRGHTDTVQCVSVTHDNIHAVTASSDRTVRIWDLHNGKETHCLEGHCGPVFSVCITQDKSQIVSVSADSTVRVWDWPGAKEAAVESGSQPTSLLCVHLSGDVVVLGGEDHTVAVYDVRSGRVMHILRHTGPVLFVHTTGREIISAGSDQAVRVWHRITGEPLRKFSVSVNALSSIAISRSERYLVTSGQTGHSVHCYDMEYGVQIQHFVGHTDAVYCTVIANDEYLLSGSRDQTIRLWDIPSGKQLWQISGGSSIRALYVIPDAQTTCTFIAAEHSGVIRFFHLHDAAELVHLRVETGVSCVRFAFRTRFVGKHAEVTLICGAQTLSVWDLRAKKECGGEGMEGHTSAVSALSVSSCGGLLASSSRDRTARIWDIDRQRLLKVIGKGGTVTRLIQCTGLEAGGDALACNVAVAKPR